jgi:hypothetical protein
MRSEPYSVPILGAATLILLKDHFPACLAAKRTTNSSSYLALAEQPAWIALGGGELASCSECVFWPWRRLLSRRLVRALSSFNIDMSQPAFMVMGATLSVAPPRPAGLSSFGIAPPLSDVISDGNSENALSNGACWWTEQGRSGARDGA